jgi:hypothetical protein
MERCLHVLAVLLPVHAGTNMNPDTVFKIRKIVWKNYAPVQAQIMLLYRLKLCSCTGSNYALLQAQINSIVLNNIFQISSKSST